MTTRERVATQCICCRSARLSSSPAIIMPFVSHRALNNPPVQIDESWGLRTVPNGTAHSICKSLLCEDCGVVFLDVRFSDLELSRLYADYRGTEYTALRDHYEPGYQALNEKLSAGGNYSEIVEKFLKPHIHDLNETTILDWGGDTGSNTPFRRSAKSIDIYDLSDKAVIPEARRVDKALAQRSKYSLVVCMQVLEHTPYPIDVLHDITMTMDSRSILYLEVPCEELIYSGIARPHVRKKHWHEHINFFSEKSLDELVRACNLHTLRSDCKETSVSGRQALIYQVACRLKH